jgi:hypothetical protein
VPRSRSRNGRATAEDEPPSADERGPNAIERLQRACPSLVLVHLPRHASWLHPSRDIDLPPAGHDQHAGIASAERRLAGRDGPVAARWGPPASATLACGVRCYGRRLPRERIKARVPVVSRKGWALAHSVTWRAARSPPASEASRGGWAPDQSKPRSRLR